MFGGREFFDVLFGNEHPRRHRLPRFVKVLVEFRDIGTHAASELKRGTDRQGRHKTACHRLTENEAGHLSESPELKTRRKTGQTAEFALRSAESKRISSERPCDHE